MVNQQRIINGYPHCGRVFLCDDVYGIVDVWQALDAYTFATSNGIEFTNLSATAWNIGNPTTTGNPNSHIAAVPVAGLDGGYIQGVTQIPTPAIVNGSMYNRAVGELHPLCRGFAMNITFRMLSKAEYARIGPFVYGNQNGDGYRAQRITVMLSNLAVGGSNSHVLIDIFADRTYYVSQFGAVGVTAATDPRCLDLSYRPHGMDMGIINSLVAIGQLPAVMMRNRSCQGSLAFRYEIPQDPSGAPWTNLALQYGGKFASFRFSPVVNPLTNRLQGGAGVLSIGCHTFNDGIPYAPTGVPSLSGGSRVVTGYPAFTPAMGQTADALLFGNLKQAARAAFNASWTSVSLCGTAFAGVYKPIVGNGGIYEDAASQTITTYIQVPSGVTEFVLIMAVQTIGVAGTHTVTATLTNSTGQAQVLATTTNATSTNDRYLYVNDLLDYPPVSGTVERYSLTLASTKSAPRGGTLIELFQSDGIKAAYLGLYS